MFMRQVVAVGAALTVVLPSCGTPLIHAAAPAIGGGTFIQPDGGAWDGPVVALVKQGDLLYGTAFCSGTLISPDLILTAAHCFMEVADEHVRVVFGTNVRFTPAERIRRVDRVLVHDMFDPQSALERSPGEAPNDIALVKLAQPAPVGVVPLAVATGQNLSVANLHLIGFGLQSLMDWRSSGQLKAIPAALVSEDVSRKTIHVRGIDSTTSHAGALPGDSGGPAVIWSNDTWNVVGVDSTGSLSPIGFSRENTYTDVRQYGDWLAHSIDQIDNETNPQHSRAPQIALFAFALRSDSSLGFTLTNNEAVPIVCSVDARLLWNGQRDSLFLMKREQLGVWSTTLNAVELGIRDGSEASPSYVVIDAKQGGSALEPSDAAAIDARIHCSGYPLLRKQIAIRWSN